MTSITLPRQFTEEEETLYRTLRAGDIRAFAAELVGEVSVGRADLKEEKEREEAHTAYHAEWDAAQRRAEAVRSCSFSVRKTRHKRREVGPPFFAARCETLRCAGFDFRPALVQVPKASTLVDPQGRPLRGSKVTSRRPPESPSTTGPLACRTLTTPYPWGSMPCLPNTWHNQG